MLDLNIQNSDIKYFGVDEDVQIEVVPKYLESQSFPSKSIFAHSYSVTIVNKSNCIIQLIERKWDIFSSGILTSTVRGEGVVGLQPILEPEESFQYTSGVIIADPVGSMHGTYYFESSAKSCFESSVPVFDLMCPSFVH